MDRLDKGLEDVMKAVQERKQETDDIEKEFRAHKESDGHALLAARVTALELAQATARQRPWQTWQVVSVAAFVVLNFASLIVSVISLLHSFVH